MLPGNSRSEAANENSGKRVVESEVLTSKRQKLMERETQLSTAKVLGLQKHRNHTKGSLKHRCWAPLSPNPGFLSCWGGAENLYLKFPGDADVAGLGTTR